MRIIPTSNEYSRNPPMTYCTCERAGRSFERRQGQKVPSYVPSDIQAESLITPSSLYYIRWAENDPFSRWPAKETALARSGRQGMDNRSP